MQLVNFSSTIVLVEKSLGLVSEEVLSGTGIPGGGERGRVCLTLHCHHHKDSCIKMGSDESHVVSRFGLAVRR